MKKAMVLLLVLVWLAALPANAQPSQPMLHMADMAGTFTPAQEEALNGRMQAIWDEYAFDVLIVTTRDSGGKSANLYGADFFEEFRANYHNYPNGTTFSFNFDIGEYFNVTRGIGEAVFLTGNDTSLDRLLQPYFAPKSYYEGMLAYLDFVETTLERHSTIDSQGIVRLSAERRKPTITEAAADVAQNYLPFIAIGALVIGIGVAFILKSRLLIAKPQHGAAQYTQESSLQLSDSSDMFLYQTVTRTRLPDPKTSSGGRGGGFHSSSGGSYGGTGGKL